LTVPWACAAQFGVALSEGERTISNRNGLSPACAGSAVIEAARPRAASAVPLARRRRQRGVVEFIGQVLRKSIAYETWWEVRAMPLAGGRMKLRQRVQVITSQNRPWGYRARVGERANCYRLVSGVHPSCGRRPRTVST